MVDRDYSIRDYSIKVDGQKIKSPSRMKYGYNPITKGERTLSGKAQLEAVAGKNKVTLVYDSIEEEELVKIIGMTWVEFKSKGRVFRTVEVPVPGGYETMVGYFAPFDIELTPSSIVSRRWENVTIEFIEQ